MMKTLKEEFEPGMASLMIPSDIPNKSIINVPVIELEIERYFKKSEQTGKVSMFMKTRRKSYDMEMEYNITSNPSIGIPIKNNKKYVFLELKAKFNNQLLTVRPPKISKKSGKIEHDLDMSDTIILDGKNMEGGNLSNSNLIYTTSSDIEKALSNPKEDGNIATMKSAQSGFSKFVGAQSDPGNIMTQAGIKDWAIKQVTEAIKKGLNAKGITQIAIKNDMVKFKQNNVVKAIKIIPPSESFSRQTWTGGKWVIISSDKNKMNLISSTREEGISPITKGIIPNLTLVAQKIGDLMLL